MPMQNGMVMGSHRPWWPVVSSPIVPSWICCLEEWANETVHKPINSNTVAAVNDGAAIRGPRDIASTRRDDLRGVHRETPTTTVGRWAPADVYRLTASISPDTHGLCSSPVVLAMRFGRKTATAVSSSAGDGERLQPKSY